jgi:hypothetical protein
MPVSKERRRPSDRVLPDSARARAKLERYQRALAAGDLHWLVNDEELWQASTHTLTVEPNGSLRVRDADLNVTLRIYHPAEWRGGVHLVDAADVVKPYRP